MTDTSDDIYLTVPNGEAPWHEFISKAVPYRIANSQRMMAWYLTKALIADTVEQLSVESVLFRHSKSKNSPDSVLNSLAKEYGLIQVTPNETAEQFRVRIGQRWSALPYYGQQATLQSVLEVVYDDVTISNTLIGSDSPQAAPKLSSDSNYTIPAYPPSWEHPSQFSVIIKLTAPLGSGSESDLLSDLQLNTIRTLIRYLKPVNWVCREIILVYNPEALLLYDDGWEWDNLGAAPVNYWQNEGDFAFYASERHRAMLDL